MKKVLWVKFGWSKYYRGGQVNGNFGWLKDAKGTEDERKGHEALNFQPVGKTYYCYVPPQGKGYRPWNDDNRGWTVVCLAKNPKQKGIHIVGWYENATLLPAPRPRPKSIGAPSHDWSYCITSKSAFLVPPSDRVSPFSNPSIGRGKYSFLAGPGVVATPAKKRLLRTLEARMTSLRQVAVHDPTEAKMPDPELDEVDPLKGFGTPEHRKRVEIAAEQATIEHFKGFKHERVTHIPCGHDFIFWKAETVLHVEVKGTSSDVPQFYLTRNEHDKGMRANPAWRLAMVTSALTSARKVRIYNAKDLSKAFDLEPYVYLVRAIPDVED